MPRVRRNLTAEPIRLSRLKGISIRYQDDLHELACVLLRLDDARSNPNTVHRHTLYGLALEYARLADVAEEQVLEEVERRGLPLVATVEYDEKTP